MFTSTPIVAIALLARTLPPITSANDAIAQLRSKSIALTDAIKNVREACKGKYRRALRDAPLLKAEVSDQLGQGSAEARRLVLDLHPCFSNESFLPFIERALQLDDRTVAFAAEVAARMQEPKTVPLLLDALEKRKDGCLRTGLEASALDCCIWLTYAPSSAVGASAIEVKARARSLAGAMKEAPYPKMKEVAAETMKAAR
jgi:hypothetical protein